MRIISLFGLAACLIALATAYFVFELYMNLHPCPLCILDRIIVAAMAVCFATGLAVRSRTAHKAMLGINAVLLGLGLIIAGRHVWLENQPFDESRGCLADSSAAAGLIDLIRKGFDAQADCGIIVWEMFGLSIPDYTLAMFALLFLPLLIVQAYLLFAKQSSTQSSEQLA